MGGRRSVASVNARHLKKRSNKKSQIARKGSKKTRRSLKDLRSVKVSAMTSVRELSVSRSWQHLNRLVVLTGLSGSGKSKAICALEDLGYFCVDNVPPTLIPTLVQLTLSGEAGIEGIAVVVDVRVRKFLSQFSEVFKTLVAEKKLFPVLIFLEASNAALIRRFNESRRPHPVQPGGSVIDGILEERTRLNPIKQLADEVLDTSDLTVHELRQELMELFGGRFEKSKLVVNMVTFGFKHGVPIEADLLFDVRFLPNPYFVNRLQKLTGQDFPVVNYLNQMPETEQFLDKTVELLNFLIPRYIDGGRNYLTIGIGCTGGRHRSVAIGEAIKQGLNKIENVRFRIKHRDILLE